MKILNESITLRAGGLALFTATLWGGNSIAIKIGLGGVPPIALAAIRFFLGTLVVLVWAFVIRISLRLEASERRPVFLLILLFLAQIYLLNVGTLYTLASRSTILISTYPFFTALFAHFFLSGDRINRLKVVGMVFSFAGVVLIFSESIALRDFSNLLGDLLVLLSGILLGARQVYTKQLTQGIHPVKLLLWQAGLSLPVFVLFSAATEYSAPWTFSSDIALAILYQGLVIAGLCFVINTSLLRRYPASRISVFGFATPVFGVIFSNILLGEILSPGILASMLLVGIGITIVNRET